VGAWRWIVFFVASAFVSSALQLMLVEDAGIGVSGVVYAMAGFMWYAREQFPEFKQALTQRTMELFLVWLVAGFVLTGLHLLNIGNVAHITGLVFGVLVALHSVAWYRGHMVRAGLVRAGIGLLIALAILPLFWAPWSVTWLSNQAYHAHTAHEYALALSYYDRIIELSPRNAWAFHNRSSLYSSIGNTERAQADLDHALQLDPTVGQQE
jgi:GlpG protein